MKAVISQRRLLHRLFKYNKETEALHVQKITGDESKSTAADLTMSQAKELIGSLTTNWAVFDKDNSRHLYILSLMRQMGWTKPHSKLSNTVIPDMKLLSDFLKSKRSPVIKPLQEMDGPETSKIITALEGIVKSSYK